VAFRQVTSSLAGQLRAILPTLIVSIRPSDVDRSMEFAVSMLYRLPIHGLRVKTDVRLVQVSAARSQSRSPTECEPALHTAGRQSGVRNVARSRSTPTLARP
jgi:hypothetical protein